jgi:hypothetical protein
MWDPNTPPMPAGSSSNAPKQETQPTFDPQTSVSICFSIIQQQTDQLAGRIDRPFTVIVH